MAQLKRTINSLKSFVTGSYAYGEPHENSDIDLVVLVELEDAKRLCMAEWASNGVNRLPAAYPCKDETIVPGVRYVLRFGRMNLLVCTDLKTFDVWQDGTAQLKMQAPVSRQDACALFKKLRIAAGIEPEGY